MKKPRIIIFSTVYYPMFSGAEAAVREITNACSVYEYDVITARMQSSLPRVERIDATTVYRIGFGNSFDKFLLPFLGVYKALQLHTEHSYAIIWSLMASQAGIAAAFFKILKPSLPLVTTLQEGDEEDHLKRYVFGNSFLFQKIILPLHRLVITQANHIQVLSVYLRNRAQNAGAKAPITIVPNGVNQAIFKKITDEQQLRALRESLGITSEQIVIVSHGRIVTKNAFDDIVRALVYLPQEYIFLVIGTGEEKGALVALARELGVVDRVVFASDQYIPQESVPLYLSLGHLFCRPSLSEGLGSSFLEAMLFDIPVIATPVGGIVDFLKDGETGLLCAVRDPESIARALMQVMNDPELYAQLTANAHEMIDTVYAWPKIASAMQTIFDSVR